MKLTEELLRQHAAEAREIVLAALPEEVPPVSWSQSFERKMGKLKRKADHPVWHRALRCVASVALAMLIGGSVWLTVDASARNAVFGWVKTVYETYFVYHRGADAAAAAGDYYPTWLPEGYSEFAVYEDGPTVTLLFSDAAGNLLTLHYTQDPGEADWYVGIEQMEIQPASVSGQPAELLIAAEPDTAHALLWTAKDETAFYVSGFVSDAELLRIAEGIQLVEK